MQEKYKKICIDESRNWNMKTKWRKMILVKIQADYPI